MNVLIVDDNSANRMTIKWVLSKFDDLQITEADSGQSAIDACQNDNFELIFMDVMMPGMTGIEATKAIKAFSPRSMVVAVTALDDDETTKEMFRVGAEDYITKPIKQDIFKARLQSYFKIIENRNFYSLSIDSINLFHEPIFNRVTIFKIKRDSNLAEFWEHFLYESGYQNNEQLCDIVAKIYNIGGLLLKMHVSFSIFCEENESTLFFSINKTKCLNKTVMDEIIKKHGFRGRYTIGDDRVSFSGAKTKINDSIVSKTPLITDSHQNNETSKVQETEHTIETNAMQEHLTHNTPVIQTKHEDSDIGELQIYDYMDEQDFLDLEEYVKDLDSVLMLMQSSKLDMHDVEGIAYKIEKIALILSTYHETYELGTALRSLSFDIKENVQAFIGYCTSLSAMFFSFTRDLLDWFSQVYKTGAPSVNFMDATIIANSVMISSTIKPQEVSTSTDIDDIFF